MAKKQTDGNLALEQQRVIVIPAHDEIVARKLRVAAYARVSSSSEDQINSYRVQNQYYSELISGNPDWEMVDIYADEGITGTSVEKREDFQRMMCDCRKGKIDRILVKSISRFARNTKDCLAAVRELKELGVSVLFEEQGIDTARVSSEMVTAIMASIFEVPVNHTHPGSQDWIHCIDIDVDRFDVVFNSTTSSWKKNSYFYLYAMLPDGEEEMVVKGRYDADQHNVHHHYVRRPSSKHSEQWYYKMGDCLLYTS